MKETEKLPYASPVEALLLSRRNKLGQLMHVPEAVGSRLSEMIHFGKADVTSKVADLPIANFHQRRSNLLVAISPLPVLIKEGPASWWHNLPLWKDCGPVLVAPFVPRRITALCRRKAFRVQLVWLEIRKDHLYAFLSK